VIPGAALGETAGPLAGEPPIVDHPRGPQTCERLSTLSLAEPVPLEACIE
jgi:hypothetical protein